MTGYTVHTGATEKFVEGWDQIFGTKGKGKAGPKTKKPAAKKKAAGKSSRTKARRPARKR